MDCARIDVSTRKYPDTWTLVDWEDYERVMSLGKWTAALKGGNRLYVLKIDPETQKAIRLHRFILGLENSDPRVGDHINNDRLDNRRCNLRVASSQQNSWNSRSRVGSSSTFLGVSWKRSHSVWRARIKVDGEEIFLGHYDSEQAAARAYDAAATEKFGAFANLNFPERAA